MRTAWGGRRWLAVGMRPRLHAVHREWANFREMRGELSRRASEGAWATIARPQNRSMLQPPLPREKAFSRCAALRDPPYLPDPDKPLLDVFAFLF